ncbi:MAG: DUF2778 domain-containing protein [Tardiphaga sp.]
MTLAAYSPLHVRIPARRNPKNRWRFLKALAFGLVAVAVFLVAIAAAVMGTGRLMPASMETRTDLRYVGTFGPPSRRLAWSTLSDEVMQSPFFLAEAEPNAAPVAALAALPDASDRLDDNSADRTITGSLGVPKMVTLERISRPVANARLDADRPSAAQKAKPRLAALSPAEIGIKPDDEVRPKTAIYDITAKFVYMPNGERLEAHSGLGRFMDDPRHVHRRMHGATPPNIYRLRLREALFHGVRAIRLTPENEKEMFGRNGILAHTYMLGPNGQSNGCVSFKDYNKFLQAFLRGEVEQLEVVARLDKLPTFARRNMKSAANTR